MVAGAYTVVQARMAKAPARPAVPARSATLIVTGAALSVDNLVVGFALGTQKVPVAVTAAVIASVSVAMSLIGLELGDRLGGAVEKWGQEIGGAVLIIVGIAIAADLF
jgi:manganese efflux pump family protein